MAMAATGVLTTGFRGSRVRDAALVVGATAFIAVSAQLSVRLPFTPVPITGQTLAVLLSGAALGTSLALASTSLYLALALAGLPVLAPDASGQHLTGSAVLSSPTLGYVIGFILSSWLVGALAERGLTTSVLRVVATMVAGNAVIYTAGLLWLHHALNATWANTFTWGMTPFLIGDAAKIAVAAGLLPAAWKLVR